MKVVIVQEDICWADASASRGRMERWFDRYPDTDLFVLPEMFSTGFCMEPERVAEPSEGGVTLEWMRRMAVRHGCAVAGSLPIAEGGKYYNRFYWVYPDGSSRHYDKRHLFAFGGEDRAYTAGQERVVVDYKGFRILPQVCYDLRFPVWARCRKDYDVAVYVANWPVARREVWDVLLRARALENQCYVIGVNRVGSDPTCAYDGGSVAVSPYGKVMASCADGKAEAVSVVLEREPLDRFRRRFPALDDADAFLFP